VLLHKTYFIIPRTYLLNLAFLFLHKLVKTPQIKLFRVRVLDRLDEWGQSLQVLGSGRSGIESDLRVSDGPLDLVVPLTCWS